MATVRRGHLRRLWWSVHRWIGLGLLILLVPIAVSGALLVYHDEFDALLNPKRWAVSGPQVALSTSEYLANAAKIVGPNEHITGIRFPAEPGSPVRVLTRQQAESGSGRRPRLITVFLDPPTGAVLDKVDFRASLFGFLHVFHENLTIPQYYGRQIIGWAGVGMLILSLTGIWLWWPRGGAVWRGLRWRRGPHTTTNLHHLLGFWISFPLAIVSLTGIYLSFPQMARTMMSSVAPMSPPPQRTFAAAIVEKPNLSPDEALRLAQASDPGARPASLFLPTVPNRQPAAEDREGGTGRDNPAPVWRAQLRMADRDLITLTINDRTGALRRLPDPLAGNRAARWIRWVHDGSRGGPVWRFVVFLTGVFPVVFAVTGLMMWWRGRRIRQQQADRLARQEQLVAAE